MNKDNKPVYAKDKKLGITLKKLMWQVIVSSFKDVAMKNKEVCISVACQNIGALMKYIEKNFE